MSLFMLNLCNASNKTSDEAPDKNVFMDFMAEMWVDGAQMAKLLWLDCSSKVIFQYIFHYYKYLIEHFSGCTF